MSICVVCLQVQIAEVNDDFCDCPDGSDEPGAERRCLAGVGSASFRRSAGTGACAGASQEAPVWARAASTGKHTAALPCLLRQALFHCANAGSAARLVWVPDGPYGALLPEAPSQSVACVACVARSTCPGSGMGSATAATAPTRRERESGRVL